MSNKIKDISILVAEDEQDLREYFKEYLEIFFHRVYSASDGEEALDIYKQKKPDIIITDINMPKLDGLSLVSKIREKDKSTKIIIMSAHSEQEKLLQAIKLHLETYLIKPIRNDDLKKVLFDTVDLIRDIDKKLHIGENIFWDTQSDTLWNRQNQLDIKDKETQLIKLLCSKPNQIFTAQEIFEYINQDKKPFSKDAVTSLMKRLRMKLPEDIIQNVYGSGYKIATL